MNIMNKSNHEPVIKYEQVIYLFHFFALANEKRVFVIAVIDK